ncbi:DMT family transporter [Massilia sp.]|uniref:DMT family transporter n=1 Tax=Massilia sp. TaxID=1882437 RepID=UPI00352CE675
MAGIPTERTANPATMLGGVLSGIASGALWGGIFVLPLVLGSFDAWQLSTGRYLIYGVISVILLLPHWRRVTRRIGPREWLGLLGLGLLGNIVYYVLVAWGVQWAGSAPTALIIGLIPVATTLLGRREQGAASLLSLLGPMALCIVGVVAVAMHGLDHAHGTGHTLIKRIAGLLSAAAALGCWAAYSLWNRRWLLRYPELSSWDWMLLTGAATGLAALPLALPAFAAPLLADTAGAPGHDASDWLRFAMVVGATAALSSVAGNSCWNRASRLLPPTMIGQMVVFETLFALLYGFLYAWRWPAGLEWLAMASLLAGVAWSARAHRTRRA